VEQQELNTSTPQPLLPRDCAWCGKPGTQRYQRRGASITDWWCDRHYGKLIEAEAAEDAAKMEKRLAKKEQDAAGDRKKQDLRDLAADIRSR
jgi:biotin synthase-related radical SAM superfamily protein